MAITVTIHQSIISASVSVTINVSESKQLMDFKNTAAAGVSTMNDTVEPSLPFLTHRAIDSACVSGAIYARRKLDLPGLVVDLLSYSLSGEIKNAEPFAIAVMIAVCKGFPKPLTFTEGELSGWRET